MNIEEELALIDLSIEQLKSMGAPEDQLQSLIDFRKFVQEGGDIEELNEAIISLYGGMHGISLNA